jgi:hypothetical protein
MANNCQNLSCLEVHSDKGNPMNWIIRERKQQNIDTNSTMFGISVERKLGKYPPECKDFRYQLINFKYS